MPCVKFTLIKWDNSDYYEYYDIDEDDYILIKNAFDTKGYWQPYSIFARDSRYRKIEVIDRLELQEAEKEGHGTHLSKHYIYYSNALSEETMKIYANFSNVLFDETNAIKDKK